MVPLHGKASRPTCEFMATVLGMGGFLGEKEEWYQSVCSPSSFVAKKEKERLVCPPPQERSHTEQNINKTCPDPEVTIRSFSFILKPTSLKKVCRQ